MADPVAKALNRQLQWRTTLLVGQDDGRRTRSYPKAAMNSASRYMIILVTATHNWQLAGSGEDGNAIFRTGVEPTRDRLQGRYET